MRDSEGPLRIERIVLASGSPRRRELLEQIGVPFQTFEPNVDETVVGRPRPTDYVRLVAIRKIIAYVAGSARGTQSTLLREISEGARRSPTTITLPGDVQCPSEWALSADTVVALGRTIMGKPADRGTAESMLRELSGRLHLVVTGLALYNPRARTIDIETATTKVKFTRLSEEEIEWYLRSEEWRGAAGGYRIQERGSVLVKSINGSYSNVVGLPIETFYGMVQAQGFRLFPSGD